MLKQEDYFHHFVNIAQFTPRKLSSKSNEESWYSKAESVQKAASQV